MNEQSEHEHTAFIRWRHTRIGRICWAVLAGIIAYVFASLAVDSGTLWQWALAVVFIVDALYNLGQFIRTVIHGNHHTN